MRNRPTNKAIIEGVQAKGSITIYANDIDVPRRTVSRWYNEALSGGEDHYSSAQQELDFEEAVVDVQEVEDDVEITYIHDQEATVLLPDSGYRTFTEEEINEFFLQFSSKGHNKTQLQIRNHFDLSARDWAKAKNHFGVYKLSNVFWDFSFDAIPPAERENAVADRLATVFRNPNKVVDRAYTKVVQREAKKSITENIKKTAELDTFITELAVAASKAPIPVVQRGQDKWASSKPVFVAVSDLHINARVEGLDIQDFNNEICAEYFTTVAEETNDKGSSDVTVLINGDIIESFTGKNHPDSFVQMEYGQTYAQGIITARDMIIRFLASINNLKKVLVISGNHDRLASSNKEDDQQGVGRILAEFLKFAFSDIEVEWSAKVLSHETENVNYLATHGDKRFTSKDANALLWKYGVKGKQNVLLTGHWHHRSIKVDDENFRHISLPSLFTGNTYSDHAGFTTKAGFALFEESRKGQLIHTDISL